MIRKGDLPTKTCATCGRPFAWRKKWARDWDNVRHCSDRCRSEAKSRRVGETHAQGATQARSETPAPHRRR
jgi:hypothetical protein